MGKKYWSLVPAIGAVAVGVWLYQGPASGSQPKPASVAVPVTTSVAAKRDLPVYLEGVGSAQAYRTVSVHAQVDGQLLEVGFAEGKEVRAGDLLAKIDPRSYQAALDQALARKGQDEAQLANARLQEARSAALVQQQYVSREQYDSLRAQVSQLQSAIKGDQASIDAAKIQLGYTEIHSPITGRAGIRQIDPGNILHGGSMGGGGGPPPDTLVMITQVQPISVVFTLPQEVLPRLLTANAKGPLEVTVLGREGSEPLETGRLEVIDNQVDSASGTVRLKATLANKNGLLWPGQYISARLLVDTRAQTVTVPTTALQRGPQGDFAYVVKEDGTVESRPVMPGSSTADQVEIVKGLAEGETVVVSGHYRLRPGTKVTTNVADAGSTKRSE